MNHVFRRMAIPGILLISTSGAAGGRMPPAFAPAAVIIPDSLPVFELLPPDTRGATELGIMRRLGFTGMTERQGSRVVGRTDSLRAEVYLASGGVWLQQGVGLWSADYIAALPSRGSALALARQYAGGLLPPLHEPFGLITTEGRTMMARFDVRQRRRIETRQLDRQVTFRVRVRVSGVGDVPMVGGGGEFNVTLGNGGKLLSLGGVWRRVKPNTRRWRTIPAAEADRIHAERTHGARPVGEPELAYYSAPADEDQRFLYPVWVYSDTVIAGGTRVEVRTTTIPASEFVAPAPRAAREVNPVAGSGNPDRDPEPDGVPRLETGAVWKTTKLPLAEKNKNGFLETLSGAGWRVNFDLGDLLARESAWTTEDDGADGVDAADFVFYTGHSDENGWVLHQPRNDKLDHASVGTEPASPSDLWGEQDLEWLVVAACGPLQDSVVGVSAVDVFDQWRGAFDGLHLLMGYGSRSADNETEGRLLARYALDGETLVNAWFRAARESQPTILKGQPVWAGVLFPVMKNGVSSGADHLWGRGTVSDDLRDPDELVAIWTTT